MVAHKWARWLHNLCCLGGPHRLRAGGRTRGGPQVGKVATLPLPPRGSPPLQGGEQNQKWPTSRQGGYIAPAAWGFSTSSELGAEAEVAHKRGGWLYNPCRLAGPRRFTAGGRIRGCPTSGHVGYIIPAVRGVPTASVRGAEL